MKLLYHISFIVHDEELSIRSFINETLLISDTKSMQMFSNQCLFLVESAHSNVIHYLEAFAAFNRLFVPKHIIIFARIVDKCSIRWRKPIKTTFQRFQMFKIITVDARLSILIFLRTFLTFSSFSIGHNKETNSAYISQISRIFECVYCLVCRI